MKGKKGATSSQKFSSSSTSTSSNSQKVNKIKEYQEKYGMSLMEAKAAVDADEAKANQGANGANGTSGPVVQNQGNVSGVVISPTSSDNPLPQTCGLGLDKSAFEQPQKTPSSEDVADLKRQLLQGKITRAEFDEKMAELKK